MNSFRKTLSNLDLKVTKSRVAILEILERKKQPVDVAEIAQALEESKIATDLVTIYRILEIFTEHHLIERVDFGEGKFRYELAKGKHHHLICEKCGRIEEIRDCPISEIENSIAKTHHFQVKRHTLEFFGLCSSCQ